MRKVDQITQLLFYRTKIMRRWLARKKCSGTVSGKGPQGPGV
jgi:hypothetical protein